ncbi:hypothetical protein [Oceanospirillum sp.]|uniref:hypothetical protein n=1 Tax=Oceanospirillum sp. TaxID=2021254 RepID=UPI003A93AF29
MTKKTFHTDNPEVMDFIERLEHWHEKEIAQLQFIVDNPDADINLDGEEIAGDSTLGKGIRIGLELALWRLGKLPFATQQHEAEAADEDWEGF